MNQYLWKNSRLPRTLHLKKTGHHHLESNALTWCMSCTELISCVLCNHSVQSTSSVSFCITLFSKKKNKTPSFIKLQFHLTEKNHCHFTTQPLLLFIKYQNLLNGNVGSWLSCLPSVSLKVIIVLKIKWYFLDFGCWDTYSWKAI